MSKFFILSLLILLLISSVAWTTPPDEIERIDNAIQFLLSKGLPKHRIYPHPRHRLLKKPELRQEVSNAIHKAAYAKEVPAPLLIAMGFREGSFKSESIGALGEETMFQMAPSTIKLAQRIDTRCDPSTIEGSAFCSAIWLEYGQKKCGDWRSSLAMYATGKTCNPAYTSHVKWLTGDRIGIARKLSKRFWSNSNGLPF